MKWQVHMCPLSYSSAHAHAEYHRSLHPSRWNVCMYGPGCSGQPGCWHRQGRAAIVKLTGPHRYQPGISHDSCVRATLGPTRYNALSSRDSRELCGDSTGTHLDQRCCVRGCVHFICVSPPRNGNGNGNGRSGHVCTAGPCQGASAATESLTSL